MGYGLTVKCESCGAEEMFSLGVGMLYFPLENVLDSVVPARNREKIRRLLEAAGPQSAQYSHTLFACPKCETLQTRFYMKISQGDKTLYETRFRCGRCRHYLVMTDEKDVTKYRCSACGQKQLTSNVTLCWD
jgi:DNA-directed RNA polymerase subunit M/transcription elongation factor TFIIS